MLEWAAEHPRALVAGAALGLVWTAESLFPLVALPRPRGVHAGRNIALGLINSAVRILLFVPALLAVTSWAQAQGFGLLRWAALPAWLVAVAAVVLLDLAGYAWHVASHFCPLLWRFHVVHHHDDAVDSTTAFRFHLGDVLAGSLVTVVIAGALGLHVWHVLLYESILIPLSIFHHGNVRLPHRIELALERIIVTPRMHRVHHSAWHAETDSNFAAVFSFWDALFGTLRRRPDTHRVRVGLDGYSSRDNSTLLGCLKTPLGPIKSRPGSSTLSEAPPPDARAAGTRGVWAGGNSAGRA
ncbi:MAG: sterol desaturase family protein [Phycisphaerales bacterium]